MIQKLYGRHYAIEQLFVTPADQGHAGVARSRTYLVLALRRLVERTQDLQQVYKLVSDAIACRVHTRPRDYLVASWTELCEEASRTARRRGIAFRADTFQIWVELYAISRNR